MATARSHHRAVTEWLVAKQAAAELDDSLRYRTVLRWLFWTGLPGFAGSAVSLLVGGAVHVGIESEFSDA